MFPFASLVICNALLLLYNLNFFLTVVFPNNDINTSPVLLTEVVVAISEPIIRFGVSHGTYTDKYPSESVLIA